VKGEVKDIGI